MRSRPSRLAKLALVVLAGCGSEGRIPPVDPPVEPAACEAPNREVQGACLPIGVPEDACAEGMESDGQGGCLAILPPEICGPGLMAVPGETVCRPVAECGDGPWGDIPLEPGALHVDPSYPAADGDGSAAKPFTTLAEALAAASPGMMIALAEGSYPAPTITQPLRIWGRCPALVTLSGLVSINASEGGTELHQLAIISATAGLLVRRSPQTLAEALWIHDTGNIAIDVGDEIPLQMQLRDSLIENAIDLGILLHGADLVVERSVIRGTQPTADGLFGGAIEAQDAFEAPVDGALELRHSLIEANHDVSLLLLGVDVLVEGSVIRDTLPAPDGRFGRAVDLSAHPLTDDPAEAALVTSILERNHDISAFVAGADLTLDRTTIRTTFPQQLFGTFGRGVQIQHRPELMRRGSITATASLIEGSHDGGLVVANADATLDGLIVRGVAPRVSDGLFGDGIAVARSVVEDFPVEWAAAAATIEASWVEGASRAGVSSFGSQVAIANTELRCNALHLDAEPEEGVGGELDDLGGNRCGCGTDDDPAAQEVECKVISSALEPPTPVP